MVRVLTARGDRPSAGDPPRPPDPGARHRRGPATRVRADRRSAPAGASADGPARCAPRQRRSAPAGASGMTGDGGGSAESCGNAPAFNGTSTICGNRRMSLSHRRRRCGAGGRCGGAGGGGCTGGVEGVHGEGGRLRGSGGAVSVAPSVCAPRPPVRLRLRGGVVLVMSPHLALRQVGWRGSSAGEFRRAGLARREVGWTVSRWARIAQAGSRAVGGAGPVPLPAPSRPAPAGPRDRRATAENVPQPARTSPNPRERTPSRRSRGLGDDLAARAAPPARRGGRGTRS